MKIVHIVAGLAGWNGMANTARQFMAEELAAGDESIVTNNLAVLEKGVDVVYIHGAWLPLLWRAAKQAKKIGAKLIVRPSGSYDPVRLAYHGWKKRLVAFFERRMLRRADVLLATCEAEKKWIEAYLGKRCPKVEETDIKRFFELNQKNELRVEGYELRVERRALHLLYLGRRHPLKGVEYLEEAVKGVEGCALRVESCVFGEEKEKIWEWCDVLVLPTLSENFGRVVAEALEHGKRVITTDGAPAWGEELEFRVSGSGFRVPGSELGDRGEIWSGYGGRLMYLKGFRDGTAGSRVALLKAAIECLKLRD